MLSACPAGKLEGGRYACDSKGDRTASSAQCPGEWRCGLEDVCHRVGDTSVAWRCESAIDCEAQFQCGIAASRDHRECHDPAAGVAWPCDFESDCSAGFQCGIAMSRDRRECHDPDAGIEWPCVGSSDCSAGFRCGLTFAGDAGECHDPAAPSAFTCASDVNCVGGWRCSAQGSCANPNLDALYETGPVDAGVPENLSPLSTTPFERVSVSSVASGPDGRPKQMTAAVRGGQLEALVVDIETRAFSAWKLPEPDYRTFIAHGTSSLTINAFNVTVPDERPRAFGVFPDGGMECLTFQPDGGVQLDPLVDFGGQTPGFAVTRLKHGTGGSYISPAATIAYDEDPSRPFGRIWGPNEWAISTFYVDNTSFQLNVPGNRIRDIAVIQSIAGHECVFISEERGLWLAQRFPGFGFEPMDSPALVNAVCRGEPAPGVNRLASLGSQWLAIEQVLDGGDARLSLLDVEELVTRTGGTQGNYHCTSFLGLPCLPQDRLPFRIELGPCAACPGSVLLDFAAVDELPGPPELEVRCGAPDSGVSAFYRLAHRTVGSPTCDRKLLLGPSALFVEPNLRSPEHVALGSVAWTNDRGQLWVGPNTLSASALVLDRPASGLAARSAVPGDFLAFTEDVVGAPVAGIGVASSAIRGLQTTTRYRPSWVLRFGTLVDVSAPATIDDAPVVALPASPMMVATGPHSAAFVRAETGARVVVVVTGSQLLASEVDRFLGGLEPYAVLMPRLGLLNAVQSLALPESAAQGGAWLEGYVVAAGRVQRLVAESPTRWRAEEVPLPGALAPLEVWFDRGRARVGLSDGAVYGLPSRVPLAQKLQQGALDFEQACTEQLVLSSDGLYRLVVASGEVVGLWEPLPLPAGFAPGGFEGGRVHALGRDVYVFDRTGAVAKMTLSGAVCP